jgi:hypothetical protein
VEVEDRLGEAGAVEVARTDEENVLHGAARTMGDGPGPHRG